MPGRFLLAGQKPLNGLKDNKHITIELRRPRLKTNCEPQTFTRSPGVTGYGA